MLDKGIREKVEIPEELEVSVNDGVVIVSGPNGELSKEFDMHGIKIEEEKGDLVVSSDSSRKERRASVGTVVSHVHNLCKGVTEGFTSKLKVFYSHFPISISTKDRVLEIENFIGEEEPRRAEIVGDTEVEVDGEEIFVSGSDKEEVGQTAANIEQTATVENRDPRVFQDGIYIVEAP